MFEFHGWVTLRSTPEAVDDEPPLRLDEIRQALEAASTGHQNEFRVHRLARGKVTEHTDPLLSPAIPVVEDPWSG